MTLLEEVQQRDHKKPSTGTIDPVILIVDDEEAKRQALKAILESLGHTVCEAASGVEALGYILQRDFAVILMDVRMPVMDGYEVATLIRQRKRSAATPIIFVTAYHSDEIEAARGYSTGGVDFIFSPFVPSVVRAKVNVFVELFTKNVALEQSVADLTRISGDFREAEIRTRTILNNVADGIISVGASGLIETTNRAANALFGYAEDEIVGKAFDSLLLSELNGEGPSFANHHPAESRTARLRGLTETVGKRQDGSTFPMEIEIIDVEMARRHIRISCMRDISERKAHIQALEYQAHHDGLTGLANRTLFGERLSRALAAAERRQTRLAVFVLDLDGFKAINDTLGHKRGDLLLRAISERLMGLLRKSDTVARLGGDEFGILALDIVNLESAAEIAWKLQQILQPVFRIDGHAVDVRASIGISLYPEHGAVPDDLLRRADLAMYEAKRNSAGVCLYTVQREDQVASELGRLGDLRHCIERQQLVLHYQPKIDLRTQRINGVEALVRWNHPTDGFLSPGDFIGYVERSELIRPVTRWIINEALHQQRLWLDAGLDLTMAVNISGRSLNAGSELPDTLAEIVALWETPPGRITLELTEGSLIDSSVPGVLERLHEMGHRISIDDFGTGYSSLAYLQRLPIDEIKIDKSFVLNLATNDADAVIVRSTVDLAHNLGLTVVAEGVEDEKALEMLQQYGSDSGQGYHFSRPCEPQALMTWIGQSEFGISK